ncbi:permease [Vibrio hippocampi]|uniref:Permease n=1 Tax=Vibrio hippocampi TaxID=654686 RepID=A0ABM8ZPA7_9VIBR|nr:permease [Vibrio hippocampi]CAH0530327.1 hypothetical protein VHP8226_03968 [Vibrio hippocampi]
MLHVFTVFADWLTYQVFGFPPDTAVSNGLHFFIEDTSKILVLLVILIYCISILRANLDVERVRNYLQGKHRATGYLLGATFGAITPFCSCSSIPLFMGFVSARIPIGVTLSFLVSSPLINEVVVIMLGSALGIKFTLSYIAAGLLLGIIAGAVLDQLNASRWLQPFLAEAYQNASNGQDTPASASTVNPLSFSQRHEFAVNETKTIVKRIWIWVIAGVGIGAFIHGFVPAQWFEQNLSQGQWWTVPVATISAIPIYTNATGIVPIMASLIDKGMPLGTTLAFCMGAVAVSLPEFMMLKQVMQWRLLAILVGYLFVAISVVGWLFNAFY